MSVLKIIGLVVIGLFLISLILAPFIDTKVSNQEDEVTEEQQEVAEETSVEEETSSIDDDSAGTSNPSNGEGETDSQSVETENRTDMPSREQTAGDDGNQADSSSQVADSRQSGVGNSVADETPLYQVVKIVDGDTVDILIDGATERIRVIGLDTPETVDPRQPVECFGLEASAKAQELLLNQRVRLEADPTQGERDTYNRLLRYIFLADGRNYSLEMVKQGYGHEYTYNLPYKYQHAFQAAENEARSAQRGLWAPDICAGQATTDSSAANNDADGNCHPAYEPCLSIVDDLNCSDVQGPVTVKDPAVDPYGLDGDNDGLGCE